MASTYLYRTNGTPTLGTKYTFSFWMKRSTEDADHRLVNNYVDSNNLGQIYIDATNNKLNIIDKSGGSTHLDVTVSHKFRDPAAFHHIVIAADTTQGTAADRLKVYINGTLQTDFALGASYPNQDAVLKMNAASATDQFRIGSHNGGGDYFDGNLAHFHFVDGTAYAASTFGETDSTSGIWKPIVSPTVTYGNNGYFLKFENSGAMGTDSSGNTNTLTVSGTMTQNVDTPTNVFTTLNPLDNPYVGQKASFSNANLTGAGTETGFVAGTSTFGFTAGKWYAEFKLTVGTSSFQAMGVITSPVDDLHQTAPHDSTKFYGVRGQGTKYQPGGSGTTSWAGSWTTNDIIGLALDCDNNRLYVSKNGQYADGSGNYDEAFTGAPAYITLASGQIYHFIGGSISTGSGVSLTMQANFGSGFFGTTAVTSANSDANGHGEFEYEVPSGYYACNTKNLKEFGG